MEDKDKKKTEELEQKLEACEKEKNEFLDGWKRTKADFSNYKKEEMRRFEQFAKITNEALITELIIVLDSFQLGLAMLEGDRPAEKGVQLIKNQFEDILHKHGLEKIAIKGGDDFDPAFHEAVGEIPSESPPGTIAEEIERGYLLNGKVLRPARVHLSKGKGLVEKSEPKA